MKTHGILLSLVLGVATGTVAHAQDRAPVVDIASRKPRFLAPASRPHGRGAEQWVDASGATVFRRHIALALRNVPREQALREIAQRSGLRLTYSAAVVRLEVPVTLVTEDITVGAALGAVLYDTGIDVLVTANARAALVSRLAVQLPRPQGTVVGRVTDTTGHGVTNAEVFLEGTRWHTTADTAGRYRLAEIDTGTYTLSARRLGYGMRHRSVTVRAEREDTVDLVLVPVATRLNELVTTATGQQRRRDIGNAITTINVDSVMQHAPIRNLTDLLNNRVPGLTVQHTSGAPGDPAKLRLRGLSSMLRSNDPVVVVDGVRQYAAQSAERSGNLTNLLPLDKARLGNNAPAPAPAPSPLDQIDPNIIEKIEVFKGPSAATLYGADAANGVIVITTKKGRPGPTRWNATIAQSRTETPGSYPAGYFRWGHNTLNGTLAFCTLTNIYCAQDSLVRFQALNDPALTVLGHGHRSDLSLTASGGNQMLTYSVTGTYGHELGLLTLPDFEVERFHTRFNQDPPDWMRRPHQYTDWNVSNSMTVRLSATADVMLSASIGRSEQQRTELEDQLAPLIGTYVDAQKAIYYRPRDLGSPTSSYFGGFDYVLDTTSTPLRSYYIKRTASTITFNTALNANWQPRSWFHAAGQAGLNVIPRRDHLLLPAGLIAPTDSGLVTISEGRSLVSTFNLQGTLRKPLKWGFAFETNVGANLTTTTTNDVATAADRLRTGTTTFGEGGTIRATEQGSNTSVYGWYIEPRFAGQRISVSTGLRIDGGSSYGTRFTRTGGGGLFGGIGLPKFNASWVISEEPWFPFASLFSSLRLRGAYGQAQVQPGAADRLRLYTGCVAGCAGSTSLELTKLGNSQLRPERSTEFEGGFDADLFDSRVSVELTGYRKLQIDALMSMELPPSVNGGGFVLTNIGNIRNRGIELSLNLTPVRSGTLTWSTQLHYSTNDNKVTKLGRGVAPNRQLGWVEGYPLDGRWARPILGYVDQNGDGVLQPDEIQVGDSLVFMGRLQPNGLTSLSTNLVLFNGALGLTAGFSYTTGAMQIDQTARTNWVLARALVDPTAPLSEQAAVVASTTRINAGGPTDYGLMQDVSTFRFNTVSLNYRVPAGAARRLGAQQLSVALQGNNLALHSTYKGKDPDVNVWSPGENIVDTGQLAQPRTWRLALYLQY